MGKPSSGGRGKIAMDAMPPYYVEFEAKRLGQDIGYFRFNHWAEPVDEKFIAALASMGDVRGLIIGLRGNPGGFLGLCILLSNTCWRKKGGWLRGNSGTGGLNKKLSI
jgi:C-terminal processing protease CtpA/Prc